MYQLCNSRILHVDGFSGDVTAKTNQLTSHIKSWPVHCRIYNMNYESSSDNLQFNLRKYRSTIPIKDSDKCLLVVYISYIETTRDRQ